MTATATHLIGTLEDAYAAAATRASITGRQQRAKIVDPPDWLEDKVGHGVLAWRITEINGSRKHETIRDIVSRITHPHAPRRHA